MQISQGGMGEPVSLAELLEKLIKMDRDRGVHNINFVTPDHFLPHVNRLVERYRRQGHKLPIVMNLSGYQTRESVEMAGRAADIYLPDYKYADRRLAASLSACPDYPGVALDAISEMLKQKGVLSTEGKNSALAVRGVLVRHLILPGHIQNSMDALSSLFVEFGADLPLSLMSQYHPMGSPRKGVPTRAIHVEEFERVLFHARELGFQRLFVQYPGARPGKLPSTSQFLPDFREAEPFGKKKTEIYGIENME
jgi:putative pyruvate formate lyase activating enzyme